MALHGYVMWLEDMHKYYVCYFTIISACATSLNSNMQRHHWHLSKLSTISVQSVVHNIAAQWMYWQHLPAGRVVQYNLYGIYILHFLVRRLKTWNIYSTNPFANCQAEETGPKEKSNKEPKVHRVEIQSCCNFFFLDWIACSSRWALYTQRVKLRQNTHVKTYILHYQC